MKHVHSYKKDYYCHMDTYSGKFLLVQNFVEIHVNPSEEIFVDFTFHVETTPTPINCMYDIIRFLRPFKISWFLLSRHQPIHEKREILHHMKISLYIIYGSPIVSAGMYMTLYYDMYAYNYYISLVSHASPSLMLAQLNITIKEDDIKITYRMAGHAGVSPQN